MYTGAHAQLGNGASPLPTPDIGIQAAQRANQRGAAALDETVNQYYRIQDFGESQKIESRLREQIADFDVEFKRRAALAPGSENALYDDRGTLMEDQLDKLVGEYADNIGELQGNFINPEARMRSDAMRFHVSGDLKKRAYGKAAELGIQRTREHFQNNYDLAIRNEDYSGAGYAITDARDNGVITAEKADIMLLDLRDTALMARAQKQSEEDPVAFWNELDDDGSPYAVSYTHLGKIVRFSLNWAQRQIHSGLHHYNNILKARQLGISTYTALLILDMCMFTPNYTAGIVDRTGPESKKKLAKIKFAFDHLDHLPQTPTQEDLELAAICLLYTSRCV